MTDPKKYVLPVVLFLCVAAGIVCALPSLPLRIAQEVLTICGILGFIAAFMVRNVWLKLFAFWNIIRFLMFINTASLMVLLVTVLILVFYETITREIKDDHINSILNVICIIALIEVFFVVFQAGGTWISFVPKPFNPAEWCTYFPNSYFAINVYLKDPKNLLGAISGTTGNSNFASALFGLSFPAFLRPRWWKCIPFVLVGLWFTHSLNGILPVLVVLFLYILYNLPGVKSKMAAVGVTLTGFLIYFLRFETWQNVLYSGSNRYEAWKWTLKEIIPMRWLEGWGVGQAPFLNRIYDLNKKISSAGVWIHPHSEILNLIVELGVIGLLIIGLYFFFLLWESRNLIRVNHTAFLIFLGVIAGLVNSVFSFSLHLPIGIIFLLFIAMLQYFNNQKAEGLK